MKKLIFFLLIAVAFCLGHKAEARPLQTKGFGQSISVNFTSPPSIIEDIRLMAVEAAKGQSLGHANDVCENQMRGHVLLTSLQFSEPQCDLQKQSLFFGYFICTIQANVECN
jgi:hypothetical protein